MKTSCFDAVIETSRGENPPHLDAVLVLGEEKIPVTIHFFSDDSKNPGGRSLIRVHASRPVDLHWGKTFRLAGPAGRDGGEGRVLHPRPDRIGVSRTPRHLKRLESLTGSPADMLAALVRENGIRGLGESAAGALTGMPHGRLLALARELELSGEIRILSFHPLHLLSVSAYRRLLRRLLDLVEESGRGPGGQGGLPLEKLQSRTRAHPRAVQLALNRLIKDGRLERMGERVVPAGFHVELSSQEEEVLKEMEALSYQGKLQTVSMDELRGRFKLSRAMLERLLNQLVERRKIVLGKDGFLLHSAWLNEVIGMLRESGQKELSVAEFKRMTGLTRKYAIPLLELLDQMGITRRVGATREIL